MLSLQNCTGKENNWVYVDLCAYSFKYSHLQHAHINNKDSAFVLDIGIRAQPRHVLNAAIQEAPATNSHPSMADEVSLTHTMQMSRTKKLEK